VSAEADEAAEAVSLLVVDDRREDRLAITAMLSSPAYRIVEASSGREALRRLLEEEFAAVLLDVVMPDMSGLDVARAIKERGRAATLPILFLTGHALDPDFAASAYRLGAVDYLLKPLVAEVLRSKVGLFAELYRQRRRIEHQTSLLIEAERKENELRVLELRMASERRYRNLAELAPQIVWTAQPDGTVDYFNQRWFEYTGLPAQGGAESWIRAVHPDDQRGYLGEWDQARRSGRMFQAECRLRRADGAFRWHLARAVPERGSTGQIVSWLGISTDIEEQKHVAEILAEFKGTLDAVLDLVMIFDSKTSRFLYANEGASALLGRSHDELLAMRPAELLVEYDDDRFRELVAPLEQGTDTVVRIDARCRHKDDKEIPVEISFQLIRVDGGHVVVIARDVTQRKLAEREREHLYREAVAAIRARDEFLSVASHELRGPLTGIKVRLDTLVRVVGGRTKGAPASAGPTEGRERTQTLTPPQMQEQLQAAAAQVDRLSRLVSELLDVSRITAGTLHMEFAPVDLAALARDVAGRFSEEASKTSTRIDIHAGEPAWGRWDSLRLEQVVGNLVSNAVKFGAGRPVDVRVGIEGPRATVAVRDRGVGIAPDDLARLFEPFQRAASGRKGPGLGMGLYIVRRIVEAHGGAIRAESQPGEGSTFTVDLPLEAPPANPGDGQPSETLETQAH
jgi:PAS domain S-box-containing protein